MGHLTDSLFNSSDAQGPFRRSLFGLTCDTLKRQVSGGFQGAGPLGPAADAALLGLDQITAPTGVCGAGSNPKAAAAKKAAAGTTSPIKDNAFGSGAGSAK